MHPRSRAILMALGLWLAAPPVAADAKADARRHFDRALELVDEGLFEEATVEFRRAYELSPHYTVLFDLGQAYVGLGKPVQAVDALTRYLSEGGTEVSPARKTQVEEEIRRQQARIAWVTIEVKPAGAVITLDGEEVGRAPLAKPVRVGVGSHRVAASHQGYSPGERRMTVAGEQKTTVVLELKPIPTAPAKNGWLQVDCKVPDVTVELDGQSVGTTPLQAPVSAASGTHRLAFIRPGYSASQLEVTVPVGASLAVDCSARPVAPLPPELAATLAVRPSEAGSQVIVDGSPFPAFGTLPAGRHVVTVIKAGFNAWEQVVALRPGTNPDLAVTLVPQDAYRQEYEARALRRRRWAYATGVAGLAVGVAAIGVFFWNDQRFADWNDEYARLPEDQLPQTARERRTSIKTADAVNVVLGVAGGALFATGAVLYFTGDNPARYRVGVSAAPGGASLSGQFAF